MSYVGFVVEQLMHNRQEDIARQAERYRQRHDARPIRRARRAGVSAPGARVTAGRTADAVGGC